MLPEWTELLEQRMRDSTPFFTPGRHLARVPGGLAGRGRRRRSSRPPEWVTSTNQAYTDALVKRNEAAARERSEDEAPPADQWMADRQTPTTTARTRSPRPETEAWPAGRRGSASTAPLGSPSLRWRAAR